MVYWYVEDIDNLYAREKEKISPEGLHWELLIFGIMLHVFAFFFLVCLRNPYTAFYINIISLITNINKLWQVLSTKVHDFLLIYILVLKMSWNFFSPCILFFYPSKTLTKVFYPYILQQIQSSVSIIFSIKSYKLILNLIIITINI